MFNIKYNNDNKALKSGIWYTISNFIIKGIGFITIPIFTRILTQEEFGSYNNFISWLSIMSILVTLNLESTLISARYDYEEELDQYIFSVLTLSSLSTILWIMCINYFINLAEKIFGMNSTYINYMLIYLLFIPAFNLYQMRERYNFGYKKSVFLSMLIAIGTSVSSIVFVITFTNRLTGRIIGHVLPTIILGVLLYIFFAIKSKKVNLSCWGYALKVCLPFIPHLLSLYVLNSVDKIMIAKFCGNTQVALYSLAYSCGAMVTILSTSLNGAFAPWLGEKLSLKNYKEIRKISKVYVFIFSFLALGFILIAPEILMILGGRDYKESIFVIAPVAMGCVFQFIYTMFVNVEQFNKKMIGMMFASVSAAVLNYILNLIFIPMFGYIAAAYTTLIGFLWLLIVHMYLVKRLGYEEVYDYKFISLIILAVCICTVSVNYLYLYNVLRYFIIIFYVVIIILIAYRYRDVLIKKIKNNKI